jgi:hypothetical protein
MNPQQNGCGDKMLQVYTCVPNLRRLVGTFKVTAQTSKVVQFID